MDAGRLKTVRGGLGLSFSCPTGLLLGLGRLSNLCVGVSYFYTTKIDLFQPLPLWLAVLWPPLPAEESATAARRQLVGKFSRI